MNKTPLLYNPITGSFYCPNVERFVLADSYEGIYDQIFILQCNHSDGPSAITTSIKHDLPAAVAVWKVKPATGSIQERLDARKGIKPAKPKVKHYMPSFSSFSFN